MEDKFSEGYELYLRHRPKTFEDILGNDSIVESLKDSLSKRDRMKRVYLFSGPSGCGKSTFAEVIGNYLNIHERDFFNYNISKMRGIDTARAIIDSCIYAPFKSDYKLYILNEAHMATTEFQNAMLDILEKPPKHVIFILCTTEPDKLIATIKNRCTPYQVSPLITPQMMTLLKSVCQKENLEVKPTLLREINKVSGGSARHALVLLEQISTIKGDETALRIIGDGLVDEAKTIELCRALLKNEGWPTIAGLLKGLNADPEKVRYSVLGYMNSVLLGKGDSKTANIIATFSESFINSGKAGLTLACFLACKR